VVRRGVAEAIEEKTREIGANLLVMGWRAGSPQRGGFPLEALDRAVERVGCDVAILKPAPRMGAFRRILIADLHGEDGALAAEIGAAVADRFGAERHRLELVRRDRGSASEPAGVSVVRAEGGATSERPCLMLADSTTEAILAVARGFDLVVVGTGRRTLSRQLLYGSHLDAMACRANASILVVRAARRQPEVETADERR